LGCREIRPYLAVDPQHYRNLSNISRLTLKIDENLI
jgi:hypothetical protein